MKRILTSAFLILLVFTGLSQTDGISYQAVIIDNNAQEIPGVDVEGNYLSEGNVKLRFTIYDESEMIEYQEVQETVTDKYGMINLIIGQGAPTSLSAGYFNEIHWDGTRKQLGVEISYENTGFQEFGRQELLFVPYVYHRNITATGTVEIDGTTTLHNSLTVTDQSPTELSGTLLVGGDATFAGGTYFNNITVENESNLQGSLTVDGLTYLNSSLNVNNNSPVSLSGSLDVEGVSTFSSANFQNLQVYDFASFYSPVQVLENNPTSLSGSLTVEGNTLLQNPLTTSSFSNLNGQVTINANVDGSQSSYSSYPLRVQGSTQGIAIKVDGGRSQTKNYLTFMDGSGTIHGRVEGQTLSEMHSSFAYIWNVAMGLLQEGLYVAEAVACGFNVPPDGAEIAANSAGAVILLAQYEEFVINSEINNGVAFLSGGADYAEWLERENPKDNFHPGEVVAVKGGKISRNTNDADHLLAISTNPIVLGNLPEEGKEEFFERVAFLGQVPIRVTGRVTEGDYILPSGFNDGLARAVTSSDLPTAKFDQIIGIAWESNPMNSPKLINVAIGLNTNDLAKRVANLESEFALLRAEFERLAESEENRIAISEEAAANTKTEDDGEQRVSRDHVENLNPTEIMSDEEFEEWIIKVGYVFEERMAALKTEFEKRGVDYRQYEETALIIDNPIEAIRKMRNGEFMSSMWSSFEDRR